MTPTMRYLWSALLLVLIVAGCSDEIHFHTESLDQEQTRTELQERGITIPASYSLVSMSKIYPPGSGGLSYLGGFDSSTPAAPILIDGASTQMRPIACDAVTPKSFPEKWFALGLDCPAMTDVQFGGSPTNSSSVLEVRVLSGVVTSGKTRIYLDVAGN